MGAQLREAADEAVRGPTKDGPEGSGNWLGVGGEQWLAWGTDLGLGE